MEVVQLGSMEEGDEDQFMDAVAELEMDKEKDKDALSQTYDEEQMDAIDAIVVTAQEGDVRRIKNHEAAEEDDDDDDELDKTYDQETAEMK